MMPDSTLRAYDDGRERIMVLREGNAETTPAADVIHTVGPVARGREGPSESSDLSSCYQNSLKLLMENNLTTVAFPCISTGIFGFPNKSAADIALKTVKTWIEEHPDKITRVIFCVFLETDFEIYREKMTELFQDNSMELPEEQLKADNTPPSKKSKSPRDQSDDINRDAVKDNDIQMESQNPDEMADEKPEDEAGEEEDDEAPDLKEREEDQPAAQPMEGGPGKPKEDMDDDSEDGESEAGNGAEADEDQE